jgi:acetyl-CoA C-acetyltransferase
MGQVLPCGYGQNPAKLAAYYAGFPDGVLAYSLNKVCGSSLKAVMLAAHAVMAGDADVVVAGGMESMSRAPYYLEKARFGFRMGPGEIQDHMIHDGIWDVINDFHMGMSNELCSEKYNVTREDQDRYAAESYRRSVESVRSGRFDAEIVPVEVRDAKGRVTVVDRDEGPRDTPYEVLAGMRPVFKKGGVTTVGNASIISDGAAATVVMSRQRAEVAGLPIMASIGAQGGYSHDMKYVLVTPIGAVPAILKKEGITLDQVDLVEINEAFSGSTVAVSRELGIDPAKLNVNGGSVAMGHPIGATGCRILVTLLHEMIKRDVKVGLACLCLGGGEAVGLVVNR